jgi:hypothetical protein
MDDFFSQFPAWAQLKVEVSGAMQAEAQRLMRQLEEQAKAEFLAKPLTADQPPPTVDIQPAPVIQTMPIKRRGRPPGSKNKPKTLAPTNGSGTLAQPPQE